MYITSIIYLYRRKWQKKSCERYTFNEYFQSKFQHLVYIKVIFTKLMQRGADR